MVVFLVGDDYLPCDIFCIGYLAVAERDGCMVKEASEEITDMFPKITS